MNVMILGRKRLVNCVHGFMPTFFTSVYAGPRAPLAGLKRPGEFCVGDLMEMSSELVKRHSFVPFNFLRVAVHLRKRRGRELDPQC